VCVCVFVCIDMQHAGGSVCVGRGVRMCVCVCIDMQHAEGSVCRQRFAFVCVCVCTLGSLAAKTMRLLRVRMSFLRALSSCGSLTSFMLMSLRLRLAHAACRGEAQRHRISACVCVRVCVCVCVCVSQRDSGCGRVHISDLKRQR